MADIDVRRRGPSIWPWIVGLVVLALLVWLLAERFADEGPAADTVEEVGTQPITTPAAVPVQVA